MIHQIFIRMMQGIVASMPVISIVHEHNIISAIILAMLGVILLEHLNRRLKEK